MGGKVREKKTSPQSRSLFSALFETFCLTARAYLNTQKYGLFCSLWTPECNRQYSYSPTVLGRVGLDHECEAHAGNFSRRGQTNMRKLRLSLPNLRKTFNIVKFRRGYTLERNHYFKQQRKICSLLLKKKKQRS